MSFMRRMFLKPTIKKTSVLTHDCNSSGVVVNDSQFDENSEDIDLIDVFRIEKKIVVTSEDLNTKFKKLAKQEKKMNRLQKHVIQMDKELVELRRMLRRTDQQRDALEAEIECKRDELKDTTCLVQMDIEVDVKKKEPLLFKKYSNIKTTADAKSLMTTIKNRQRALQHLEMLTFKKYLNNNHDLKKEIISKNIRRNSTSLSTPPKKTRRSYLPTLVGGGHTDTSISRFFVGPLAFQPNSRFNGQNGLDGSPRDVELRPHVEEGSLSLDDLDGIDDIDMSDNTPLVSDV